MANGEIYHVYNRTVANEETFSNSRGISRALDLIQYYKYASNLRFSFFNKLPPEAKGEYLKSTKRAALVEIYAYALMPIHFHLLVKQISDKGIEKFLSNFQNGYARYYNIRNKRFGALFQRPFKAKHVSTDEELLHLSRYIHLNPVTSYITEFENLKTSPITSLSYYLSDMTNKFINTELVGRLANSRDKYLKFVKDQVSYQRQLSKIRHLLIEK